MDGDLGDSYCIGRIIFSLKLSEKKKKSGIRIERGGKQDIMVKQGFLSSFFDF